MDIIEEKSDEEKSSCHEGSLRDEDPESETEKIAPVISAAVLQEETEKIIQTNSLDR